MKDTVKAIIESSVLPEVDFLSKNTASLHILDSATAADRRQLQFIPTKVTVMKRPMTEGYLVEYANNLERLMLDQEVGIVEAMQMVCDTNDIPMDECAVVFDESCVNKIDIGAVIKLDPEFDMIRV